MFKNKEKGFTLMEILVVVTILGLLVVIAIPSIKKLSQNINHKIYTDRKSTRLNSSH